MSQHPHHVAEAIALREAGWKWSEKKRVWYKRVPGTDMAVATRHTAGALATTFMQIVKPGAAHEQA